MFTKVPENEPLLILNTDSYLFKNTDFYSF